MDNIEPELLGGDTKPRSSSSVHRKATLTSYNSRDLSSALGAIGTSTDYTIIEEDTVIRSGILFKKGVINKGWKRRIFVLTPGSLFYYDRQPEPDTIPKGEIDLDFIYKIDRDDTVKFNVRTPSRIYRLRAETEGEREAWIAAIYGALENQNMHNTSRSRKGSDVFDDSLSASGAPPSVHSPHTPAEINKWEKWNAFEVAAWLTTFGYAQHSFKFFSNRITGDQLESLSTADLENIGVSSKTDQLKILQRVKKLVQEDGVHGALLSAPKPGFEN